MYKHSRLLRITDENYGQKSFITLAQVETLSLITNFRKLRTKKFYNIAPGRNALAYYEIS
jgi:hypothetical protein